ARYFTITSAIAEAEGGGGYDSNPKSTVIITKDEISRMNGRELREIFEKAARENVKVRIPEYPSWFGKMIYYVSSRHPNLALRLLRLTSDPRTWHPYPNQTKKNVLIRLKREQARLTETIKEIKVEISKLPARRYSRPFPTYRPTEKEIEQKERRIRLESTLTNLRLTLGDLERISARIDVR
ncbi:MAG: hypothetical protein K8F25_06080, partial [Fimbriimonadaceae bacterium]|nr:hypothetical protein [Alphaproteobacteria bacterium]